jgi:flavin-dependent dehydrogenase
MIYDSHFDVIVIGAGPSGSTLANLLAQHGLRVLILDKAKQPKPQIPQTFYGLPTTLLKRLDVENQITAAIEQPKPVRFISSKGTFNFQIIPENLDFQSGTQFPALNRSVFDKILLDAAVSAGVVHKISNIVNQLFDDNRITQLICDSEAGEKVTYSADFYVDASGKSSIFSNCMDLKNKGLSLDNRVGVFSHFTDIDLSELLLNVGMTIISIDGGYILLVPLIGNKVSVIVIQSHEKFDSLGDNESIFWNALELYSPLVTRLKMAKQIFPVLSVINNLWNCTRYAGKNFILTGDAAIFSDPFNTNGVENAMVGAEVAAYYIIRHLIDQGEWTENEWNSYGKELKKAVKSNRCKLHRHMDNVGMRELIMACADPHLPWNVSNSILSLVYGATKPVQNASKKTSRKLMENARKTYQ